MIVYDSRKCLGLGVLCRFYGSAFPRAVPYALISMAFSIYLSAHRVEFFNTPKVFFHPYAHQVFAITAGFLLVFRSQLAYQRFWEGRSAMANMQSKWSDSAMQSMLYDDCDGESSLQSEVYRLRMAHLFSLLHACSVQV